MTKLLLDIVSVLFDLVGCDEVEKWLAANDVIGSATNVVISFLLFQ